MQMDCKPCTGGILVQNIAIVFEPGRSDKGDIAVTHNITACMLQVGNLVLFYVKMFETHVTANDQPLSKILAFVVTVLIVTGIV